MLSTSGKLLIEFLEPGAVKDLKRNALTVDRKEFDPQFIDFSTGRASMPGYQCGGLGEINKTVFDKTNLDVGTYTSDLINVNNAMICTANNALYFWQLRQHFYKSYPASYGQPDHTYSGGTDQYGTPYYTGVWRYEVPGKIQFIFDVDQMKLVDMYAPNFFYGNMPDRAGVSGKGTHTFTQK